MKRSIYLAYGSNLNIKQMTDRCPDAIKIGVGTIENYKLNFRGTRRGTGVANIERCRGMQVPVGVWAISKNDELSLDMYEGYPYLYMKDYLRFTFDDKDYIGLVYIMRPGHPEMLPSIIYENTIREGYKDFGIQAKPLNKAISNVRDVNWKKYYANNWCVDYSM